MLDNILSQITYKNKGWKKMQAVLDDRMPSTDGKSFDYRNLLIYLLFLFIGLSGFALFKFDQSLDALATENQRLSTLVQQADFQNATLNSLLDNSMAFSDRIEANNSTYLKNRSTIVPRFSSSIIQHGTAKVTKPNIHVLTNSNDPSSVLSLASLEGLSLDEINFNTSGIPQPDMMSYPNKPLTALDEKLLAKHNEVDNSRNAVYTLASVDKSLRFNGMGAGIMTSMPIRNKLNLSIGLGYLWTKNYDAIQAKRVAEISVINSSGESELATIEFDTKILVDHLHYIQLPISFDYQVLPKLNLGVGLESRFLVNNYHTDGVDTEYNSRFNAYIVNTKNPEPYEYNIRKIAMGFNGGLEYQVFKNLSVHGHFYSGLLNISGDKVFNNTNNIKNSSYQLGLRYYWGK